MSWLSWLSSCCCCWAVKVAQVGGVGLGLFGWGGIVFLLGWLGGLVQLLNKFSQGEESFQAEGGLAQCHNPQIFDRFLGFCYDLFLSIILIPAVN